MPLFLRRFGGELGVFCGVSEAPLASELLLPRLPRLRVGVEEDATLAAPTLLALESVLPLRILCPRPRGEAFTGDSLVAGEPLPTPRPLGLALFGVLGDDTPRRVFLGGESGVFEGEGGVVVRPRLLLPRPVSRATTPSASSPPPRFFVSLTSAASSAKS